MDMQSFKPPVKKAVKRVNYTLFSRMALTILLLVVQIVLLVVAVLYFSSYLPIFYVLCFALSILVVLLIVNKQDNPAYKLALVVPILLSPIFGGLFYLIFGRKHVSQKRLRQLQEWSLVSAHMLPAASEIQDVMDHLDPVAAPQIRYLQHCCGWPAFTHTHTAYYSPGEKFFEALKESLRSAKHFIFLEYFIIEEGKMWNEILEILQKKVKEGVEIRVLYDDIGCSLVLPLKYDERLRHMGIQCRIFNPFLPVMSITFNNRDHRKIAVIDGHTAFTGGINLADEYINAIDKYGHWKDSALRLQGDAAWGFTVMFLNLWNSVNTPYHRDVTLEHYADYQAFYTPEIQPPSKNAGIVIPFGSGPDGSENSGVNVYLNMIGRAERSIRIFTPYFVVDNETLTALCLAAKSGIDVRIITPCQYDKWYVHMITRSYYPQLIEAGVRIYEYTPGFIHSKAIVCDETTGVVGSINFDFRSMYLHFECAAFLYGGNAVQELLEDFEATQAVSRAVTYHECTSDVPWYIRLLRSLLRLLAPLM